VGGIQYGLLVTRRKHCFLNKKRLSSLTSLNALVLKFEDQYRVGMK